jgi:predicted acyl esterase
MRARTRPSAPIALAIAVLALPAAAEAAKVESALGIPCAEQAGGVQFCEGSTQTRVPTFDRVPLDANVTLPPASVDGPYPLIVDLHGFGGSKSGVATARANDGYAVLSYTARGFGESCGTVPSRAADPSGCAAGWAHLADARFEARDTQYLAGRLVDEGLAKPGVGVTGTSYGGVQSMILATLRDRVMQGDGSFAPWVSPDGTPMRIAAAAPIIPFSDLASALIPNGRKLDYVTEPSYFAGDRIGTPKLSYVGFLSALLLANYFAPPPAAVDSDGVGWVARFTRGEPYDGEPEAEAIVDEVTSFHSSLYLEDRLPPRRRKAPAPMLIYNAWTDDLNPASEAIWYANKALGRHPEAEISMFFAHGFGHPRAPLTGSTARFDERAEDFFARHLQGAPGSPLGVETYTQPCGAEEKGPFVTPTWAEQHPGEVAFTQAATQTIESAAGNPALGAALDPFAAIATDGCVALPAAVEPGAATYTFDEVGEGGYTLVGSPTVIARMKTAEPAALVAARLWDVAPSGEQRFVTRGVYRPDLGSEGMQVFQLVPNGWTFKRGHTPRLELLGRDSPYTRAPNGAFTVETSDLELRLPVHEAPGDGNPQVEAPRPSVVPDGQTLLPGAGSGSRCANSIAGTRKGERLPGTAAGDRMSGRRGADRLNGRAGDDCMRGGRGADRLRGGPGADTMTGGTGNDHLNAADGEIDTVRCGSGRDRARLDPDDTTTGCESKVK